MRYIPDLSTLRKAGPRRARRAADLVDFLKEMPAEELAILRDSIIGAQRNPGLLGMLGLLPPIAGGAEQVNVLAVTPTALGAAAATYQGPVLGVPQAPLILAFHYVPTVTGANAAATLTFVLRRTDTPANISSQSWLTATADTNPRGPVMLAVVPSTIPAGSGVDAQGTASAGAGTLTASATAPLILAVLGFN